MSLDPSARRLIPDFDGAIFALEWREVILDRIYMETREVY